MQLGLNKNLIVQKKPHKCKRKSFPIFVCAVVKAVVDHMWFIVHTNSRPYPGNTEFQDHTLRQAGVANSDLLPCFSCCYLLFINNISEEPERVSWLAIAWDRRVQVYKLVKSEMKKHSEWSIDSAAIGVAWLDDQVQLKKSIFVTISIFIYLRIDYL